MRAVFGRIFRAVGHGAKAITWSAGLLAAISAIVLFVPSAFNTVFWRPAEYDLLTRIHAGESSNYVTSLLGQPALVKGFPNATGLTQSIYLRRDHVVMTIVDDADRVIVYSVLSCDPEFAPSFTTPIRTTVGLQQRPLGTSEIMPGDRSGSQTALLNARAAVASPPITVSSVDQLVETGIQSGSNAARTQSWFVGINGACADNSILATDLPVDTGRPPVESIDSLRDHTAANFYAETATDVTATIADSGELVLPQYSPTSEQEYVGTYASPFVFDLPIDRIDRAGTRTF